MKYLPLYYKWMEAKKIDSDPLSSKFGGLCGSSLFNDENFNIFIPTDEERLGTYSAYWAFGRKKKYIGNEKLHRWAFTPLRQNIVLLMAAMNNEL